jgi:hypothetical protein
MKILERLRNRSPRAPAGAPGAGETSSTDADRLPFPGYDKLDHKELGARLNKLSQVELAAVEGYERSHKDRPEVLAKLRYMHTSEPLPGYDALSPEQVAKALAGADAETVKAVRDYERKFENRAQVMEDAARALSTAPASAREDRTREGQAALVREGFASRAETAGGLASRRSAPEDPVSPVPRPR